MSTSWCIGGTLAPKSSWNRILPPSRAQGPSALRLLRWCDPPFAKGTNRRVQTILSCPDPSRRPPRLETYTASDSVGWVIKMRFTYVLYIRTIMNITYTKDEERWYHMYAHANIETYVNAQCIYECIFNKPLARKPTNVAGSTRSLFRVRWVFHSCPEFPNHGRRSRMNSIAFPEIWITVRSLNTSWQSTPPKKGTANDSPENP